MTLDDNIDLLYDVSDPESPKPKKNNAKKKKEAEKPDIFEYFKYGDIEQLLDQDDNIGAFSSRLDKYSAEDIRTRSP